MSMISGLIDELNKSADEWNSSNMFELARMCRDAADTIWQLRDDLQRANAENAKLRERGAKTFEVGKRWMAKAARFESENTKLRELVLGLKWCCENYGCNNLCPLYDKSEQDHCREERLLSELGIEVDE